MPKLKMTLPRAFAGLLEKGDVEGLKMALLACDPDARGGSTKQTALAYNNLPDEVARWLVERGADISAQDGYGLSPLHARAGMYHGQVDILLDLGADPDTRDGKGETPLHKAADVGNVDAVERLLQHGARSDVTNFAGLTPLMKGLAGCENVKIVEMTQIAERLVADAKARDFTHPQTQIEAYVTAIGGRFETYRSRFDPETLDETSDALDKLYALFKVAPVPRQMA